MLLYPSSVVCRPLRCGTVNTAGHREAKSQPRSNQYLTPSEEKALAGYVLRMADRGYPAPVKLLRYLAWVIARPTVLYLPNPCKR
jgi:hypothetical protein